MYRIIIKGVVQGVGFRPAVYRIASNLGLKGYVRNIGNGEVEVVVDKWPERFVEILKANAPALARIKSVHVERFDSGHKYNDFSIVKSDEGKMDGEISLPPVDSAICNDCLRELMDEKDRRYEYAFISCTACGPRFTVFNEFPFDRKNTTFCKFKLCEDCEREYNDIESRRYYAQTIACQRCGPDYTLISNDTHTKGTSAVMLAAKMIDEGGILGVKGWGGYHIACVTDDDVVRGLRTILKRPQQPFALMARDINAIKRVAHVNTPEEKALISFQRPIVVLKKKRSDSFYEVSPGLDTLGIMLPYAPLHHLLFKYMKADFIVMTSANMPGEPMFIDEGIMDGIKLDGYLVHNLKIASRCDDSVVKILNNKQVFIRRSRGYVPKEISINTKKDVIAVGAELYNSICVVKNGKAIMSQYVGDTSKFTTYNDFFKNVVGFFIRVLKPKIKAAICDMHPLYNTSNFARELSTREGIALYEVQHHFAHAMSVMAERDMTRAVAIVCDGAGYGFDGNVWGGEVLLLDFDANNFKRVGHIENFELIGGDLATRYPLRVLFSILRKTKHYETLADLYSRYLRKGESFQILEKQLENDIGVVKSSSAGRYMDAISAMLKLCFHRTYEGEPAMKLESVAKKCEIDAKPQVKRAEETSIFSHVYKNDDFTVRKSDVHVLEISGFVGNLFERLLESESDVSKIAYQAIVYLADGLTEIASKVAKKYDMPVVLSGGVMVNRYFVERAIKNLKNKNIDVILNELVAPGDNGISLGQAYLARFV